MYSYNWNNVFVFFVALISESASLNTQVVGLVATDNDIGNSSKIRYLIAVGNEANHFRIDSDNGLIYTNAALDYESVREYSLVVEAKDTKHTSQATVTIQIQNINDNSPVFNPSPYRISIPENQKLDEEILTVNASDLDPFGGLTFSFDPPTSMFAINSASGSISVAAELDRETADYYNYTVRAADGGSPALHNIAVVEIHVTDTNDNRPIFSSPVYEISVPENSRAGKFLVNVKATDADIGINANLRYEIVNGNEARKFKLDTVSGNLSVIGDIDREKVDAYRFEFLKIPCFFSIICYYDWLYIHTTYIYSRKGFVS